MLSPYGMVMEKMFRIVDEDGNDTDFILNAAQRSLDENFSRRNIIPKSRRRGISSYMIGRFCAKCLGERNRSAVIISHDAEATGKLLDKARYIVGNLKGGVSASTSRDNRGEIHFDKTNSSIYIGTAGSRNFGRGDTITDLHCSEVAFWPDAKKLVRGLFQAARSGEITLESTGNGVGNWYHRQVQLAAAHRGYRLHFFNWLADPVCATPFEDADARRAFLSNLMEDIEEDTVASLVSPEQLHWRREQIIMEFDGDLRAFKAEYPMTLEECFQSTGYSFFQKINYKPTPEWTRENRDLWTLAGHPNPQYSYVVGADVGGGVGLDSSVAEVICLDTMEQVAELAHNYKEPHQFGLDVAVLARRFNMAYVNPERNNHGLAMIQSLLSDYPSVRVHRGAAGAGRGDKEVARFTAYGTYTQEATRGFLIGTLRTLAASELTVHSPRLHSEMQTFIEKDTGKIEADTGCHDDAVMGMAMATYVIERAALSAGARRRASNVVALNPFSLDGIISDMTSNQSALPIPRQDAL